MITFEEKEDYALFNIHYKATPKEANEVWLAVCDSVDALRYDQLTIITKQLRVSQTGAVLDTLTAFALEQANLEVKLAQEVVRILIVKELQ